MNIPIGTCTVVKVHKIEKEISKTEVEIFISKKKVSKYYLITIKEKNTESIKNYNTRISFKNDIDWDYVQALLVSNNTSSFKHKNININSENLEQMLNHLENG